jgi:hypothetical protein
MLMLFWFLRSGLFPLVNWEAGMSFDAEAEQNRYAAALF